MKNLLYNLLDAGGSGGPDGGGTGDGGSAGNASNSGSNSGSGDDGGKAGLSWDQVKAAIPEELRNDSSMSSITSLDGLVKSYVHAQKAIGKEKISIPDKHATEDDWKELFYKLGVPRDMEKYDFALPKDAEVDDDARKIMREAAFQAGLLPWQMEKVFGKFYEMATSRQKQQFDELSSQRTEQQESLKKEWGEKFDSNVKRANVAFKHLVPDEADREALIELGLGSHPTVMKILVGAAQHFKEDVFIGQGSAEGSGFTPKEAEQKALEIMGDANHPYRRPEHPNHKNAKEEVKRLWQIAYPE